METKPSSKQVIGKTGECLAARYLIRMGYTILERNWRSGRCEIDLISSKDGVIHFFEVKTRRTLLYGWPEEYIRRRKIRRLMTVVEAYVQTMTKDLPVQLNILSIVLAGMQSPIFYLIEDIHTACLL
jgi:putative endonuclease